MPWIIKSDTEYATLQKCNYANRSTQCHGIKEKKKRRKKKEERERVGKAEIFSAAAYPVCMCGGARFEATIDKRAGRAARAAQSGTRLM